MADEDVDDVDVHDVDDEHTIDFSGKCQVPCHGSTQLNSVWVAFNNIYALGLCAKSTEHTFPIKLKHSTTAKMHTLTPHTHTHRQSQFGSIQIFSFFYASLFLPSNYRCTRNS